MNDRNQYYVLRFRSDDDLHKKGDIQYVRDDVFFIGQTPECQMQLPPHPDFADTCYAVIVRNKQNGGWLVMRQETKADISVGGESLTIARNLMDGDILQFDGTIVRFNTQDGDAPIANHYVQSRPQWGMWLTLALIVIVLAGVLSFLYMERLKPMAVFKHEIQSICKVEVDTVMILSSAGDTLDIIPTDRSMVGTGFITEDGYFVTARHSVECWLAMEGELRPDPHDILSPLVRWAISAETDTTVRLISRVAITRHGESEKRYFCSDDFTMDKSRDALYDYGNATNSYIWRSVVSLFEKQDTELGDVAVMKWKYGNGTIRLCDSGQVLDIDEWLCCFGYPQTDYHTEASLSSVEGKVFQSPKTSADWYISDVGLDYGFSGGPVFLKVPGRPVAGIVSRSAGNRTLIVPISQVQYLMTECDKKSSGQRLRALRNKPDYE